MRRLNSQFKTRFLSEPGADSLNSTYYGYVEMDQYFCLAVAEGYDGEGGAESAKLAVDAAMEAFVQKPGMSPRRLRACMKRANKSLREQSIRIRLKAGLLLLVSDYTRFRYSVCGNVMLFLLRNAAVCHQSLTHTVYQSILEEKQEDTEALKPEEETRNLYHYLGGDGKCKVSSPMKLADGDVILTATERFWSRVGRVEILDAFESFKSEDEFLEDLQELYVRGSAEDVPGCCLGAVEIVKAYKENTKLKKKIMLWTLILVLAALIICLGFFIYNKINRKKQSELRNTIAVYEDTGDRYMGELSCTLAAQEYEKAIEAGKKLKKNEERLEKEQVLSGKINIGSVLEEAKKAFEARSYTQARAGYKKALELIKGYGELYALDAYINQRIAEINARMEIDNYMQSAALKEAAGDLEAAEILYDRAEAMLRIVDDPETLKQAQLAKLRVKGQSEQEGKEERARKRDEVIIDADKTAAVDAVLAEDYETAIDLYTKIRDAYISLEENEKAEEITALIATLQKKAKVTGEEKDAATEESKAAALSAVLEGDLEEAAALYQELQSMYLEAGEQEKADEMQAIIDSLSSQETGETAAEKPNQESGSKDETNLGPAFANQKTGKGSQALGPGEAGQGRTEGPAGQTPDQVNPASAQAGPASGPASMSSEQKNLGQDKTATAPDQAAAALQEQALRATADRDFPKAVFLYEQLREIYVYNGNMDMAGQMETILSHLNQMMQESGA